MRRSAVSFWLASFLLILSLSCSTDKEVLFEPHIAEFAITSTQRVYGRCPSVSEDARVLAWVHVDTTHQHILRWERPAPIDTLYRSSSTIEWIDLSDDGTQLVAQVRPGATRSFLFWPDVTDTDYITRTLGLNYPAVYTPRCTSAGTILFGAQGPRGGGAWRWDPTDDSIDTVCVRFASPQEQWLGRYSDLDQTGELVCFESLVGEHDIYTIVCRIGPSEELFRFEGGVPRFWSITPDENGILYTDSRKTLRGMRLKTGEIYYVIQDIFYFDVSPDGRWLFAEDTNRNLILRDLRNLR